jgi:phosphoribosylformimino-5-aminoimidazole carboxamide ribonucleotide (ProFAR) isomerase
MYDISLPARSPIPAVVDAVENIPVIAAGGIADGRGLAAALMLGAAGVLCGTAFFASRGGSLPSEYEECRFWRIRRRHHPQFGR